MEHSQAATGGLISVPSNLAIRRFFCCVIFHAAFRSRLALSRLDFKHSKLREHSSSGTALRHVRQSGRVHTVAVLRSGCTNMAL